MTRIFFGVVNGQKICCSFLQFPPRFHSFFIVPQFLRTMDLQPLATGDDAANAFAQRGALCLARLSRLQLTAQALGGLIVPDPVDETPCLSLYVVEALYAPMFSPSELAARHPFALFSIAPEKQRVFLI